MLSYLHSCLGQAECTEQISRGRQWRKYEALERSRRCSSRASQRTSLHLHFCCSRNVAHQEQAIDKAMTFQEELAQTGEKSDPQVLPRKPRHQ